MFHTPHKKSHSTGEVMSTMEKCGPLQQKHQQQPSPSPSRQQTKKSEKRIVGNASTTNRRSSQSSSSSNGVDDDVDDGAFSSRSCSLDEEDEVFADTTQRSVMMKIAADVRATVAGDLAIAAAAAGGAAAAAAAGASTAASDSETNPPIMPATTTTTPREPVDDEAAEDDALAGPSGIGAADDGIADDDDDVVDADAAVQAVIASSARTSESGVSEPVISRKDARLIAELRAQIPKVFSVFNLHQRIGEGTFSTVYLATLRDHENRPFHKRRCFAIKHLIPTSHPNRVERELRCMLEIGGTDNVAGVDLCIRSGDAVAFVMPYVQHDKFHDYFNRFDARELQTYMRNLLISMRRVHSFGVIHRDVKPSNFLHDRKAKKYLLVDFGLAQCAGVRPTTTAATTSNAVVAATATAAAEKTASGAQVQPPPISFRNCGTTAAGHCNPPSSSSNSQSVAVMLPTKKRRAAEIEETENCSKPANAAKRGRTHQEQQQQQQQLQHEHNTVTQYSNVDAEASVANEAALADTSSFKQPLKQLNEILSPKSAFYTGPKQFKKDDVPLLRQVKTAILGYSLANQLRNAQASPQASSALHQPQQHSPRSTATAGGGGVACYCYGKPTICNLCIIKKEVHASRAGTPGYRPPEVLLKNPEQTTAVDMWAIGVIMISILSACYPFFKGADDFTALAEMITVFGDEAIKKAALSMSRHVCHSQKKRPLHLRKLCIRLRSRSGANTICTTDTTRRPPVPPPPPSSSRHSVCDNCQQISPECLCQHSPLNMDFTTDIFPASAYDLMARLLCINPAQRISAEEALQHPFLWADL